MLYPVYVHLGDASHAHGVTFPDFPGCFAAADGWDDLPGAIQEAVQAHFYGEPDAVPPPTPLDQLAGDARFQGGVWLLVDLLQAPGPWALLPEKTKAAQGGLC